MDRSHRVSFCDLPRRTTVVVARETTIQWVKSFAANHELVEAIESAKRVAPVEKNKKKTSKNEVHWIFIEFFGEERATNKNRNLHVSVCV